MYPRFEKWKLYSRPELIGSGVRPPCCYKVDFSVPNFDVSAVRDEPCDEAAKP